MRLKVRREIGGRVGGRGRGRPAWRAAGVRDKRSAASTTWGCPRTGPARLPISKRTLQAAAGWVLVLLSALAAHSPEGAQAPAEVTTFGGNAQHTSIYEPAAADLNAIRWSTSIDLNQSFRNAHYGAPIVTASNVILVPVKTATDGFQVSAFDGATGAPIYAPLDSDYRLPAHNWYPTYNPALATLADSGTGQAVTRLYYAGAGGTLWYVDRPDSPGHSAPVRRAFYGLDAYQANPGGFSATVYVNTPLTTDRQGNVFFGFRVQGTAPAPLSTTESGFARIAPDGSARFVLASQAAADPNVTRDSHNSAPALSHDESLLYVVAKSATTTYAYLLALDATTLQMRHRVFLRDPRGTRQNNAAVSDDSTASPTVAPDGDVYFGVQGNPGNGSRGFLLRFSGDLAVEKTPGGFGWDSTAAIVPAGMVPSYTGPSSYLIFAKYNNYATADGDGVNRIALLDPDSTQIDPHPSAGGLVQMREVLTVIAPVPDRDRASLTFPHAVREWCINTAAVNPATRSIFAPNEDGFLHRWDLATNSLAQSVALTPGFLEPYVPTIIGPDGTVFTLNGGTLFAVGRADGGPVLTLDSSRADVRAAAQGDTVTFTARLNGGGSGTVIFRDVHYPDQPGGPASSELARIALVNGVATFTTSSLAAGAHFISATHEGTGTTVTRVQEVHRSATTTVVGAPEGTRPSGPVTFTALVAANRGGTPTGMVTFQEGTRVLAQMPLSRERTASITLSDLGTASRTITAAYASDPLFAASTGVLTFPDAVAPATPTGLTATPGPNAGELTLTWQPNPESDGVLVYEIWRDPPLAGDPTLAGTSVLASFVDVRNRGGRLARYFVVAVDGGGNRSAPSAVVWGRTR